MWFLPYEKFTIKTQLTPKEIHQQLTKVVGPKPPLELPGFDLLYAIDDKPYQGKVKDHSFRISRTTPFYYRNTFLPLIKGKVQADVSGYAVNVTMYPDVVGAIFLILFLNVGFMLTLSRLGIMDFLLKFDMSSLRSVTDILYPIGFLIFSYGLMLGSFKFEAVQSKAYLRKLLKECE